MSKKKKKKQRPRPRAADKEVLAEAPEPEPVPARRAQLGLRVGQVFFVVLATAAVVVPALAERWGAIRSGAWVPAMFTEVATALGFPVLSRGFSPERHGPGRLLLTVRTVTGRRTVDLGHLTHLRRARYLGNARTEELIRITDRQGVSLRVEQDVLMGSSWRTTLVHSADSRVLRDVKLSRYTAVGLGFVEPSTAYRVGRACVDLLLGLYVIPMMLVALALLISWLTRTV